MKLEGLTVGRYDHDGVLAPSKAIVRAIGRAEEALVARGCVVRPFELPDVRSLVANYLSALSADDGDAMFAALAGGEIDPVLVAMKRFRALPLGVRRMMGTAARTFGQDNMGLMLGSMGSKSAASSCGGSPIDSAPTGSTSSRRWRRPAWTCCSGRSWRPPRAFPHGLSKNFTLASSYTIVFNATQLPAGVVPGDARVRPGETTRPASRDAGRCDQAARVDAASEGLPIGVQIAARPWKDHVALAVMGAIEAEVSRDEGFPATPVPLDAA